MSGSVHRQRAGWGLFFVSPWIISFATFTLYPLLLAVKMSFLKFNALQPDRARFVGFANHWDAVRDPDFWRALFNVLYNQSIYIALMLGVSLALAILLAEAKKGGAFFRTVYFLPVVTSITVAMIVVDYVAGVNGPLQRLLIQWGILREPIVWKLEQWLPMPVLAVFSTWKWFGVNMLIFLGAISALNQELFEVAAVDGAGWWDRVRRITIPLLNPQIVFVLTMSIINGLQMFTEVFMLFDLSGGPYHAGLTPVLYLYKVGFANWNMGYASTLGLLLAVVIFVATRIQLRLTQREVD